MCFLFSVNSLRFFSHEWNWCRKSWAILQNFNYCMIKLTMLNVFVLLWLFSFLVKFILRQIQDWKDWVISLKKNSTAIGSFFDSAERKKVNKLSRYHPKLAYKINVQKDMNMVYVHKISNLLVDCFTECNDTVMVCFVWIQLFQIVFYFNFP